MENVCKNVSSRPSGLYCRFYWKDSACPLFLSATTQLFSQSLSSHNLCSRLEVFSTTNNICNFWRSKFHPVSTHRFCSWDETLTQKWNCSFSNNLCWCTGTTHTLSSSTFIERNLYLSWSSHFVTSFRLEMKVGGFSKHQNKTSDTDRHRGWFSTTCVSQVNVNTMKKNFWAVVWIAGS